MQSNKSIQDPFGNSIHFPAALLQQSDRNYNEISKVITSPSFLIKEKNRKLYFFRLIRIDVNLLIEVRFNGKEFVVNAFKENPTAEYISSLLKKGALFSF